ncbi:MAG TPA: MgtC/SapB family protein [Bryobacteraceae bacterium]|jgi:putative Mg2+ transporter-C (MgtC) family protein
MQIHPEWSNLLIRLLSTAAAGAIIGYDRGEHGRPAGLRTTMLVALAACVAMIQANLLMDSTGKTGDSFVVFDLMRFPLGILSGMGFIGAGAILRKDNLVLGVTTAATLWFVTVLGLCFGGGQIVLGFAGLAIGFLVLAGLRRFEGRMKQERLAALTVVIAEGGPGEEDLRARLAAQHFNVRSCSLVYSAAATTRELTCEVSWLGHAFDSSLPEVVRVLTRDKGVEKVVWSPQTR